MEVRSRWRFLILLIFAAIAAGPTATACAKNMYAFDLDSLAYLSTSVIEGDVVGVKTVNWVDVLNVKVTRTYSGGVKAGQECVVGLSAYAKKKGDCETATFAPGDHLILFIQPVTQDPWRRDGIPYWPAPSGVKLIADGRVTGMLQESNPGAYLTVVDDGDAKAFRKKVESAVKWAAEFLEKFTAHQRDAAWLLVKLKERPVRRIEERGWRDDIAVTLCAAIAATHDRAAISEARKCRTDPYEQQLLSQK